MEGDSEPVVRVGKRKAWLEPGPEGVFFGWQRLRAEMEEAGRTVWEAMGRRPVRLYGELCGGLGGQSGTRSVQTGIFYSRDLWVLWFDCLVDDATQGWQWLSDRELRGALRVSPVVPLLARGPEALEFPVRFETRVPAMFGERAEGWAEGWVAKDGGRCGVADRWVVKRKIPEFDERGEFDESRPFDAGAAVPFEELLRWGRRMGGSEARWASARSKVGEDERAVGDEVVLDVMVDLEEVWPVALRGLTSEQVKELEGAIRGSRMGERARRA